MKKVILLTGVMIMMYAASAFATGPTLYTTPTGVASGLGVTGFNASKNVAAVYSSGTATVPAAGFLYYSIATRHASGSKKFAAISTDTGMYGLDSSTALATGDIVTVPSAAGTQVSGWTSM